MKILQIVYAILREIGDESAYKRFLLSQGLLPSRENWRRFSEERMSAKYRKPKCC